MSPTLSPSSPNRESPPHTEVRMVTSTSDASETVEGAVTQENNPVSRNSAAGTRAENDQGSSTRSSIEGNPSSREKQVDPLEAANNFRDSDPKKMIEGEKRHRDWNRGAEEGIKKTKVNEEDTLFVSSPARLVIDRTVHPSPVLIASGWPQPSPIDPKPSRGGREFRCRIDNTHESSSTPSGGDEEHAVVAHRLFNGSFDTIDMDIPEQIENNLLQPTNDDIALLLAPRRSPRQGSHHTAGSGNRSHVHKDPPNRHQDVAREENSHSANQSPPYQEPYHSPRHSPPHSIVHVDVDGSGPVDLSPIKFPSPPIEAASSQRVKTESPPDTHTGDQTQAAEVSFDTSAGTHSYHRERERHRKINENVPQERRIRDNNQGEAKSHSTSTLSEAKTPPRKGRAGYAEGGDSAKEYHGRNNGLINNYGSYERQYYERHPYYDYHYPPYPPYPMAHPIRPDTAQPYYIGNYYPHHPSFHEEIPPPGGTMTVQDPARAHHGRHHGATIQNDQTPPTEEDHNRRHYIRGQSSMTPAMPPRIPHLRPTSYHNHSESRNYPPPRARLPPNYNGQQRNSAYYPGRHPANPSNEITTQGHQKSRRGTTHLGPAPPRNHQRHPPALPHPHMIQDIGNESFTLIRSVRKVFQSCSYLLFQTHLGVDLGHGREYIHTDPNDLKVARKRVESAICALGGYIKDSKERDETPDKAPSNFNQSPHSLSARAFPCRTDHVYANNTPNLHSSTATDYDIYHHRFHQRYNTHDTGVSWKFEEDPPVSVPQGKANRSHNRLNDQSKSRINTGAASPNRPKNSFGSYPSSPLPLDHNKKMKYRCKLCGQPKHNHVCPYRKSLVRTLGITVSPDPNSYHSEEPGILTQFLSKMNNFVPYGRNDESIDRDNESVSLHPSSVYSRAPGSSRKSDERRHNSSSSSFSTSPNSSISSKQQQSGLYPTTSLWQPRQPLQGIHKPLFMALALRPEHYRRVTPRVPFRNSSGKADRRDDKEEGSYKYPPVPMSFDSRKRLSDTLFYLSKSNPNINIDISSLLRMARERDEWDLAVAEVLTQVIVCLHCSDGDYRLDGLRRYLLTTLGIAS